MAFYLSASFFSNWKVLAGLQLRGREMDLKNLWEHWDFTVSIKVICKQYNIWLFINGGVFFFFLFRLHPNKGGISSFPYNRAVFCRQLNFRVFFFKCQAQRESLHKMKMVENFDLMPFVKCGILQARQIIIIKNIYNFLQNILSCIWSFLCVFQSF